jgi:molybdenum cofactor cytidylyltransferase
VIAAVLLAAGASTRMGTPKALLSVPNGPNVDEPLVRRVAQALRDGGASPVIVVVRPEGVGDETAAAVAVLAGVLVTPNPEPGRGMLSSVQAGLRRLLDGSTEPPAAFLVCPCDLPLLGANDVAGVIDGWNGDPCGIVVPTHEGSRGHPTLFGAALVPEVLALDSRNYGLNELVKRHAVAVREVPARGDAVVRDADTPDEWRTLCVAATER